MIFPVQSLFFTPPGPVSSILLTSEWKIIKIYIEYWKLNIVSNIIKPIWNLFLIIHSLNLKAFIPVEHRNRESSIQINKEYGCQTKDRKLMKPFIVQYNFENIVFGFRNWRSKWIPKVSDPSKLWSEMEKHSAEVE